MDPVLGRIPVHLNLLSRLLMSFFGVAVLSAILTLLLQHRSLERDLDEAARSRARASASTVEFLIEEHLESVRAHYDRLGRIPWFRDALDREPSHLVETIRALGLAEAAARVVVVAGEKQILAGAGEEELDPLALAVRTSGLLVHEGRGYFAVRVDLEGTPGAERSLVALEPLRPEVLRAWTSVVGGPVVLGQGSPPADVSAVVSLAHGTELWVYSSSRPERHALASARTSLLKGALLALAGGLLLSLLLCRAVANPILEIREAAERIGRGDLSARVEVSRRDEIGAVANAMNEMAAALERHRDHLEEQVAERTRELSAVNAALAHAKSTAEGAVRARTEFLANMSHEIRTPMTALLGFADMLLEEGDVLDAPPHRMEALLTIKRNGAHLLEIINDILDLSKIEAGRLDLEVVRFSPMVLIEEVRTLMTVRATSKGLDLFVEYEAPLPRKVKGDPTRIRQVLMNLTSNAIKFTQAGSVRVVAAMKRSDEGARLRVSVMDTGLGIPRDRLDELFLPFRQADIATTRLFGGTGLGLTICKRLCDLMDGTLEVESVVGRGSTFHVEFPVAVVEEEVETPTTPSTDEVEHERRLLAEAPRIEGRILLAEDSPDNQRLISWILQKAGASVTVAGDGRAALDRAVGAWEDGVPYDVILMDVQMPELDGYGVVQRLREIGYPGPVIALTAHAMPQEKERCLEVGCDDFAAKPIDRIGLVRLVAAHMEKARSGT